MVRAVPAARGFLVIFFESVLLGVILPGDALLFTMGLFAATGTIRVDLWLLCLLVAVAAILGNIGGYWLGATTGSALFTRPNSRLFNKKQVDKVHRFFDRHGPLAIILARFVPFARTFITLYLMLAAVMVISAVPIVAGARRKTP